MAAFSIIEENGQKFAKIPLSQFEALEDELDGKRADAIMSSGGELWPSELVNALSEGGNPIKYIREWHHGITQSELANATGITQGYISSLEKGTREPSIKILASLHRALRVAVDDLIPWP